MLTFNRSPDSYFWSATKVDGYNFYILQGTQSITANISASVKNLYLIYLEVSFIFYKLLPTNLLQTKLIKTITHFKCVIKCLIQSLAKREISSSHGGEYEAQNHLRCTAVFLIECRRTFQSCVLPPSSGRSHAPLKRRSTFN
jgi:hypothetical protein